MDSGLIPFYIYTAWFAHQNWVATPDNENRWKNIFNHEAASTDQLLFATFLTPTVVGGLHLISLGLGLYLTMLFRKIANLPPDMNPLEDNLTSRKHQHKNSEASAAFMMQKPGYMSGSTLNVPGSRHSKSIHEDRTVDFRHSRTGSDFGYSPHNPQSAQLSRQAEEERSFCHDLVQRPGTASRASRQSFAQAPNGEHINQEKRDMDSFSFVGSLAAAPAPPPHTSQGRSLSPRPGSSVSVRDHAVEQAHYAPTHAHTQSQQKESLLNDNWFINEESKSGDLGVPLPPPSPSQRRTPNFSRPSPVGSPDIDRAARFSPMLSPLPANHQAQFMPEPLRMNPPTPPNDENTLHEPRKYHFFESWYPQDTSRKPPRYYANPATVLHHKVQHNPRHDSFQDTYQQSYEKYPIQEDDDDTSTIMGHEDRQPLNEVAVNRSHTNASAQSSQFAGSSVYSESAPELRSANHVHQRSISNFQENLHVKSVGTPKKRQYGDLASAMQGVRQQDQPPSPPKHSPYARVVSRTGADITDESLYVPENTSRRRYVSGKAAEEGMAGGRW